MEPSDHVVRGARVRFRAVTFASFLSGLRKYHFKEAWRIYHRRKRKKLLSSNHNNHVDGAPPFKRIVDPSFLHQCARFNKPLEIRRAISAGVDPNVVQPSDPNKESLAITAAKHGSVDVLDLLLNLPTNDCTTDNVTDRSEDNTDGGWFVHAGKWDSPLWQYSEDGWSPLMHAVKCNQLACAKRIVDAGADAYLTDYEGNDAVHVAISTPYPSPKDTRDMLALMITEGGYAAGGDNEDTGEHMLLHAARCANATACDVLLRAPSNPAKLNKPNKKGESAMLLAARAGCADAIDVMIAFAVERSDVVMFRLPQEHATGDNAIHAAVRAGSVDCIRAILRPLTRRTEEEAEIRKVLVASLGRRNRKERCTPRELASSMQMLDDAGVQALFDAAAE